MNETEILNVDRGVWWGLAGFALGMAMGMYLYDAQN